MSAFKGLYLKDLKISASTFFIGIILLNLITLISLGLKEYFDEPMIPAVIFFVVVILHAFYLPGMLLSSLQIEGQSQLWLHNPNSTIKLLLSKIAAGLTYYAVSIAASMLLARLSVSGLELSNELSGFSEMVNENLFVMVGGITLASIYINVWILFYWSLYHSLKVVPILNQIRWLVLLIVWIVLTTIGNFLSNTPFVRVMKNKGTFNISVFETEMSGNSVSAQMASINITTIIVYILLTIGVFLASVWLLERKVEV